MRTRVTSSYPLAANFSFCVRAMVLLALVGILTAAPRTRLAHGYDKSGPEQAAFLTRNFIPIPSKVENWWFPARTTERVNAKLGSRMNSYKKKLDTTDKKKSDTTEDPIEHLATLKAMCATLEDFQGYYDRQTATGDKQPQDHMESYHTNLMSAFKEFSTYLKPDIIALKSNAIDQAKNVDRFVTNDVEDSNAELGKHLVEDLDQLRLQITLYAKLARAHDRMLDVRTETLLLPELGNALTKIASARHKLIMYHLKKDHVVLAGEDQAPTRILSPGMLKTMADTAEKRSDCRSRECGSLTSTHIGNLTADLPVELFAQPSNKALPYVHDLEEALRPTELYQLIEAIRDDTFHEVFYTPRRTENQVVADAPNEALEKYKAVTFAQREDTLNALGEYQLATEAQTRRVVAQVFEPHFESLLGSLFDELLPPQLRQAEQSLWDVDKVTMSSTETGVEIQFPKGLGEMTPTIDIHPETDQPDARSMVTVTTFPSPSNGEALRIPIETDPLKTTVREFLADLAEDAPDLEKAAIETTLKAL